MATAGRTQPSRHLEPQFAALLPELVMTITPEQFAMIAARAMAPRCRADRRAWVTCTPRR
jgi:segregation and condensation protein A